MDTQAVDSGFSSSSPADRQSPSPKARFALPSTDAEETRLDSGQSSTADAANKDSPDELSRTSNFDANRLPQNDQPFKYAQLYSGSSMSADSTQLTGNGDGKTLAFSAHQQSLATDSVPQESSAPANQNSAEDCALDLSANSISFPRMFNSQVESGGTTDRPSLALDSSSLPQQQQMLLNSTQAGTQQMNNILSSLTAKVTGQGSNSINEQTAKMESLQEQDASHLIKHNKIAEPPNCGCVNKPCE